MQTPKGGTRGLLRALDFRVRYRAFVDAFRTGAQRLRDRACELAEMFPLWSFPPALPFNAPA
jgi:hypothetical protein